MADWTAVTGGRHITLAEWSAAAAKANCRVAFAPDVTAIVGGEMWIRFGHPLVADDRDVLVQLAVDVFHPASNAPVELIDKLEAELARLREIDAPLTLLTHHSIAAGWANGGAAEVARNLAELARVRRAKGDTETDLEELRGLIAHWSAPDATLDQSVLLRARGWTIASFVAEPVLALAYAEACGGSVGRGDSTERCDADVVARALSGLAGWGDSLFPNGIPDEVPFTSWDELPDDDG